MAKVTLKNVHKVFPGGVVAVKDFTLEVKDKEFLILVGPSGCGKTTTLRAIAGLEEVSEGEIYIGDRFVNDVAPKDRDIAMVFQNYALYPHMTVFNNMAFGLKLRKTPKDEIKRRVAETAKILDIGELLDRKPKALSGGQRQRVALGRAIVRNPKVFLMDEPLSNLDAKLRVVMRTELSKLHRRLQTTFIYVTHDQVEAMTMGDRIVVMDNAVIKQVDTPYNLYAHPDNLFVAGFIGSPQMNFIEGKLELNGSLAHFIFGDHKVTLSDDRTALLKDNVNNGDEVILGIRPEDIYRDSDSIEEYKDCVVDGVVEVTEPIGAETYLYLKIGDNNVTARTKSGDIVRPDSKIKLVFDPNKLHLFDKKTELALL